ncbi:MAG TPA: type VI secretion system-associated FHA domain protein, partial [Casimicrobiaceae bacterium]|nr:type VI secretion system-associated FHA domain protein [Casimicrobiaceae bacterium]
MYEISVVSYQGVAPADRIAAVFGADGGTIGRGSVNTLVLPDPNRFVSRIQAKITVEGGRLAISNASSANPLLVNDRELDAGAGATLADGDELRIGLYLLRVRRLDMPHRGDDASDMTQLSMVIAGTRTPASHDKPLASAELSTPPRPPASRPPAVAPRRAEAPAQPLAPLDPLQLAVGSADSDPFADLIPSGRAIDSAHDAAPAVTPAQAVPPPATSAGQVPDDVWNDLARLAPTAGGAPPAPAPPLTADFDAFTAPSATTRNPDDPLAEFAQRGLALEAFDKLDAPIDTLFTDTPAKAPIDDVIPDPHAAPEDPLATPESVDPMAIFGGDAKPAREFDRSESDQVPELEAWFRPPEPRFAPAMPETSRDRAPPPARESAAARSVAAPLPSTPRMRANDAASEPVVAPRSQQPPRAHDDDALLHAFLAGAGIPNAIVKEGLTPDMMKAIGTMLATAVQGTIELIATRAMLKREVKADVTLIATTKNNPLKFLPDAESALLQMFGARIPGFMGPVDAMQDAFR